MTNGEIIRCGSSRCDCWGRQRSPDESEQGTDTNTHRPQLHAYVQVKKWEIENYSSIAGHRWMNDFLKGWMRNVG